MTRAYDVVTFDCYGTLIDWEDGIASAFTREAEADGVSLDRSRIIGAYHEVEPTVEAERYESYRDVLARTARRVADRLGWELSEERSAREGGLSRTERGRPVTAAVRVAPP